MWGGICKLTVNGKIDFRLSMFAQKANKQAIFFLVCLLVLVRVLKTCFKTCFKPVFGTRKRPVYAGFRTQMWRARCTDVESALHRCGERVAQMWRARCTDVESALHRYGERVAQEWILFDI